jgi:hypothetical protein
MHQYCRFDLNFLAERIGFRIMRKKNTETTVGGKAARRFSSNARLFRHALMRSQVQAAISTLPRGYEASTGFSVVRLDLRSSRRVLLDAVPASKRQIAPPDIL